MKLRKVVLKNFRSYKGENIIEIEEDFTAFIGKNDAGKSTVLEALDIFFNGTRVELDDLCKLTNEKEVGIGCIFSELPNEVNIDTSAKTTLKNEFLLNDEGALEVVKIFKSTSSQISLKPDILIRAVHPTKKGVDDLLKLKNAELKERGKNITEKVADKRQNNLWRKAIWEQEKNLELKKIDLVVGEFESKVKAMYANLELLFPQYFLLKSDREATDSDSEAKDPMQLAVKEAQKEFQGDIYRLQNQIQTKVDEVTTRALKRLKEMDPSLAKKLVPSLKSSPKWSFDYRIEDEKGIALNKRGSGTRRLVLLNFFRAEAEHRSRSEEGTLIYAVEEPETSQHPHNQRLVFDSLLLLSSDTRRQVMISTHSPQLVEKLPAHSIKFIENTNDLSKLYVGKNALELAADSLGILSHQKLGSAKAVVIVEGEGDDIFLSHVAKVFKSSGLLKEDLTDAKILILPAGGGGQVKNWAQRYRLKQLGLPHLIFIDSDRKATGDSVTENENLCKDLIANGDRAIYTRKREIENYIDPIATGVSLHFTEYDDAKTIIANATYTKPEKVIKKFWTKMSTEQIKNASKYRDDKGKEHIELEEIINEIMSMA